MKRLSALNTHTHQKKDSRHLIYAAICSLTLLATTPFTYAQTVTGGGHNWELLPSSGQNEMEYLIQTDNIQADTSNPNWQNATMLIHPLKPDLDAPYRSLLITFTVDCSQKTRRSNNATIYMDKFAQGKVFHSERAVGVFETSMSETEDAFIERVCK